DGKQTTGTSYASAADLLHVATDSLGRIITIGILNSGSGKMAVTRYMPTGALDTTFGGTGTVTIPCYHSGSGPGGLAIDSYDRIVIAGGLNPWSVTRLTASGALDTSFGVNGEKDLDYSDHVSDVAIDSQGRVVVAGTLSFTSGGPLGGQTINWFEI